MQEERAAFDIHSYGDQLAASCGRVGEWHSFASLVAGKPAFEVCRSMLASLQLVSVWARRSALFPMDSNQPLHPAVGCAGVRPPPCESCLRLELPCRLLPSTLGSQRNSPGPLHAPALLLPCAPLQALTCAPSSVVCPSNRPMPPLLDPSPSRSPNPAVAPLQANDYTVEISQQPGLEEAVDTMRLRLLTQERAHERFHTYMAPSVSN